MPKIMDLTDCKEMNRLHPDTFHVATDAELDTITPGTHVKLIFNLADFAERMWVQVTSVNPDGSFLGTLDNDPIQDDEIQWGDLVAFERKHVAGFHDFAQEKAA